jgi:hypothetical protein
MTVRLETYHQMSDISWCETYCILVDVACVTRAPSTQRFLCHASDFKVLYRPSLIDASWTADLSVWMIYFSCNQSHLLPVVFIKAETEVEARLAHDTLISPRGAPVSVDTGAEIVRAVHES